MAKLGTTINPHDHDTEQNDFELLPNGIYKLEIIASDVKEDENDSANTAMNATISVIEPEEYANRRFFIWVDTQNRDPEKQAKGQREISKLARAMFGNKAPTVIEDSEELHLKSFIARVKKGEAGVSKASRPYKARNSIQKYFYPDDERVPLPEPAIDEVQPASKPAKDNRPAAANQNAAPRQAAAGGAKPWGSKK
ncbi:DUF669 domain-containing protein [Mesorhizobium retamae]|uniref:DUF669 domain-containing protein n=1 Tax=Mesorhizobium retamae TaxID=2912854 RepID=A0ABS9QI31_9HYPH|nr:DUF669 domain-containing protein [Mesorhizobium sp. IRAMC:0171]MCG7507093.1 DUF669 domain-containing protein [Mesorhizobium sp. IRAMC:0171]